MRKFPGEEERCNELRQTLGRRFDVADRVFDAWLVQPRAEAFAKTALPTVTINLATALDVQAARLFRSVVDQCARGEAQNGHILSRTLFETVVAQAFLLAERVSIFAAPLTKKGVVIDGAFKAQIAPEGDEAQRFRSREARAELYQAHMYLEQMRDVERTGKFPDMADRVREFRASIDPSMAREHEAAVGPEWWYILNNYPCSYSGLSIAALASAVGHGLDGWYRTIYGFQSRPVHANDPYRHLQTPDGKTLGVTYLSRPTEVRECLHGATMLFLVNIGLLVAYVPFGEDAEILFNSLRRGFEALSE